MSIFPLVSPQRFRFVQVGLILLLAAAAYVIISALAGFRDVSPLPTGLNNALRCSFGVASGALCLLRALLVRGDRAAWATFGTGLIAYGASNIYFYTAVLGVEPFPFPSLADAGWIFFYLTTFATVILLMRGQVARFHRSLWLDAMVGGLGVAALASGIAVSVTGELAGAGVLTVVTNLTYPLADLLLIVVVITVFGAFGWRPGTVWWLLGCTLLSFTLGDIFILLGVGNSTGAFVPSAPTDILWAVAGVLPAFAAWHRQPRRLPRSLSRWGILVLPAILAFVSLALLVLGTRLRLPTVTIGLAAATILAALVRAGVTFAEVQQLAVSRQQARTDELTGLANRRGFLEGVARAERRAAAGVSFALLLLDLDRFKEVNDSLGHQVGDDLLTKVGARIATALRPGDLLARLGGDEFAVLLENADTDVAKLVADRVLTALTTPFDVAGVTLHIDASIGAALCPEHAPDSHALLQHADIAMYAAKAARTGVEFYRPGSEVNSLVRLDLVEALRGAPGSGQLLVHYQVKVDLRTGRACGVEALARWQHPGRGMLRPDEFVPLAEQTGLMHPLTYEILEMSLAQCRRWWDDGIDVTVAVNLSVSDLLDQTFPDLVAALLDQYGLPPRALELEITESKLIPDHARSTAVLGTLRGLGIRIAIDDYGTGYCSLSYLRELPIDVLKLDKSFTRQLGTNHAAGAIVRSTVGLAHSLGLDIVVEGVESLIAVRKLEEFGCDLAQGYYFGRPQPADEVTDALRSLGGARGAPTESEEGWEDIDAPTPVANAWL